MKARARHRLFCYGTLEFPPIMETVTGRRFPCRAAVLPGYRRLAVRKQVFPGIVAQTGAEIGGTLYHGLTSAHLRLLDAYENAFYRRRYLRVRDAAGRSHLAWVYVVPGMYRHRLTDADWDPAVFLRQHYACYLRSVRR
ncbi:MAG: gamma-glutamylcyclotransferase [Gammaproteobacteria bacterium]|nr:gamma-glutamylcyclotransferase [Gammaproteobacteria bacterium]